MNFDHEKQIKLVKTTLNKQDHFFVLVMQDETSVLFH